jgi:hypothetical protein
LGSRAFLSCIRPCLGPGALASCIWPCLGPLALASCIWPCLGPRAWICTRPLDLAMLLGAPRFLQSRLLKSFLFIIITFCHSFVVLWLNLILVKSKNHGHMARWPWFPSDIEASPSYTLQCPMDVSPLRLPIGQTFYGHPLPPWTPQVVRPCIPLVETTFGSACVMASLLLEFLD